MGEQQAKKWLVISALWVAGIWTYRRWREGPQAVTKLPEFFTAWGVVYFVLSMITEAAPGFGGAFSILVMVADTLTQGKQLIATVMAQEQGKPGASSSSAGAGAGGGLLADTARAAQGTPAGGGGLLADTARAAKVPAGGAKPLPSDQVVSVGLSGVSGFGFGAGHVPFGGG